MNDIDFDIAMLELAFDPDEARDEEGRWTTEAGRSAAGKRRALLQKQLKEHQKKTPKGKYDDQQWVAWRNKDAELRDELRKIEDSVKFVTPDSKLKTISAESAGIATSKPSKEHLAALKEIKARATAEQREMIKLWTHKVSRGETPVEPGFIRSAERGDTRFGYQDVAKKFNKALDVMPKFQGVVYRGLDLSEQTEAFKNLITVGNTWTNKSSASATKEGSKALNYGNVILRIKSKTGADISSLEKTANREVVLRKGTRYRVTRVQPTVMIDSPEHKKFFAQEQKKWRAAGVETENRYRPIRATVIDVEEL